MAKNTKRKRRRSVAGHDGVSVEKLNSRRDKFVHEHRKLRRRKLKSKSLLPGKAYSVKNPPNFRSVASLAVSMMFMQALMPYVEKILAKMPEVQEDE